MASSIIIKHSKVRYLFWFHHPLGVDTVGAVLGKVSRRSQDVEAGREVMKQSLGPVSTAEDRGVTEHRVREHS